MQLLLDLPEISPELSKAVETDPIRLREWLISLPSSDVVEAGRAIFDALASLNRIDLGVETRITLLGEYETMLDVLAGGFEAAYASAGLPMKDRAKQAATLYKNLWLEMAMGWKVALVTRMEKRGLFSNNKVDPHFVQRILYCFWRFYRINSRLFMPMPKGLWGEIHQMFRLGAENKFLDEPTEPKNRSIATTYKRLLLLSLADPLRFAPPGTGQGCRHRRKLRPSGSLPATVKIALHGRALPDRARQRQTTLFHWPPPAGRTHSLRGAA